MRFAASSDGKRFSDVKVVPTPQNFEEGVALFGTVAGELGGGKAFDAIAGGVAGPLNKDRTRLVAAPNLPSWVARPLKRELEIAAKGPVHLENDTNMNGLGEVYFGAGRGHDIVVYLTVSTGVGGSRFVDGRIDASAFGFEPGHQIIDASGALCPSCSKDGRHDLESYISGKAFEQRFRKKPFEVTDLNIWDEAAHFLAYGLNNTIVHWSPEVIVLGGSMITGAPGIPLERVEYHLNHIMQIFPVLPKLEKAQLGDEGGLWGALIYLGKKLYNS